MREQCTVANFRATARTESSCSASGKVLQPIFNLRPIIKAIFPTKTANKFAAAAQISERMARYHLSSQYEISAPALASLLRSEHGLSFLEGVMGDARPGWWKSFKRRVNAANLENQIEELQRQLDEVRRADRKE